MEIKKKRNGKAFFAGFAVIAASAAVIFFAYKGASVKAPGAAGSGGRRSGAGSAVSVKTMVAKVTTLHGYIATNGEIESQNSVSAFPDMGGKVMSTSIMLGSEVKKGQVIAYVDPSEPGTTFRSSPVYAPISGSVISRPLENGTKVSTSTAVAIIGDIKNLQVSANVPERYIAVLKKGLKAIVNVEAYPGVNFPATVSRVSPVVDSASRTKEIILLFDRRDSRINAGMFAKVTLYTEDYKDAVVMPSDAVVQNGENYFAYVVNEDSKVSKRKITLGNAVDGLVQILEGVKPEEIIVIQGQTSLADGSLVKDISGNVKSAEGKDSAGAPNPDFNGTKPSAAKGQYLRSVTISATMSPGVKLNPMKLG